MARIHIPWTAPRKWNNTSIGRTPPLLKPRQSPHCYLGAVDHAKNTTHRPLVTLQARSYRAYGATQTLLFSSPLVQWTLCRGLTQFACYSSIEKRQFLPLSQTVFLPCPSGRVRVSNHPNYWHCLPNRNHWIPNNLQHEVCKIKSCGPFYSHWLTSNPGWISKHMPSKERGEINYPFANFNGEVWEWISSFIPLRFNGYN